MYYYTILDMFPPKAVKTFIWPDFSFVRLSFVPVRLCWRAELYQIFFELCLLCQICPPQWRWQVFWQFLENSRAGERIVLLWQPVCHRLLAKSEIDGTDNCFCTVSHQVNVRYHCNNKSSRNCFNQDISFWENNTRWTNLEIYMISFFSNLINVQLATGLL